MKKLKILFVVLVVCFPFILQAAETTKTVRPKIILNPAKPGPGDIVIITVKGLSGPLEGKIGEKKLYFNPSKDSFKAVFGVDLYTEPGKYTVDISENGKVFSKKIKIAKKDYPVQKLTLPKDMVELSPENEARVEREQKKVAAIWPGETGRHWDGNFMNPREGEISTAFGLRRIINGIAKNPHSGVDVSADEGKEVLAPNNAVVVLVDNQFFSGNSVILDHGQGIYTMFFHLSKILVSEGQQVKKGDVIALVGSTGRSTGAHLHWGARVQGARVDPIELIKLKFE
jgi:murein DD-endopeptidase MepM/ murein hydrolase activator NlpD